CFFWIDITHFLLHTLSLHDALPISCPAPHKPFLVTEEAGLMETLHRRHPSLLFVLAHLLRLDRGTQHGRGVPRKQSAFAQCRQLDRKSTRLNSSHVTISYADFCVKK